MGVIGPWARIRQTCLKPSFYISLVGWQSHKRLRFKTAAHCTKTSAAEAEPCSELQNTAASTAIMTANGGSKDIAGLAREAR